MTNPFNILLNDLSSAARPAKITLLSTVYEGSSYDILFSNSPEYATQKNVNPLENTLLFNTLISECGVIAEENLEIMLNEQNESQYCFIHQYNAFAKQIVIIDLSDLTFFDEELFYKKVDNRELWDDLFTLAYCKKRPWL